MNLILRHGLPADPELERFVLGSLLLDPESNFRPIAATLNASDFSIQAHQLVWNRAAELESTGTSADRVMVARSLQDHGELEAVGGLSYLVSLADGMPRLCNLDEYVRRLKEKSTLRRAALEMHAAIDRICAPGAGVDEVASASRLLQELGSEGSSERKIRMASEIIRGEGEDGDDSFLRPELSEPGITSPWPRFDRLAGGLKAGQLIILAARPAVGKSTAAAQLALHTAEEGIGAVLISLEMPAKLILRRLAAGRAEVDFDKWSRGLLNADERKRVSRATFEIAKLPLAIDDQPSATVSSIQTALIRHRARHSFGLVVVDYLQLVNSAKSRSGQTRNDEVSAISRGLKLSAMELQVPVVALSQITRDSDRESRPPRLSDLRDSGAIEQDADKVVFLHPSEDLTELRLAKNRTGPLGKILLRLDGPRARFTEAMPPTQTHHSERGDSE
jgi:replicative DNA helicase